jgi:hypothetical protein
MSESLFDARHHLVLIEEATAIRGGDPALHGLNEAGLLQSMFYGIMDDRGDRPSGARCNLSQASLFFGSELQFHYVGVTRETNLFPERSSGNGIVPRHRNRFGVSTP